MMYTEDALLIEDLRLALDTRLFSIEDIAYMFDMDVIRVEELIVKYDLYKSSSSNQSLLKRIFL